MQDLNEILEACKRGERLAQRQLYEKYKGRMFAVCLRYADKREDAEDMLQEGFIQVFKDLSQFKMLGSFEGWMRKVVVNVALQYIRQKRNPRPPLLNIGMTWIMQKNWTRTCFPKI
ncbi:MAG: sigma-70 family RNA polymerase sigma factor [Saprospirales bacterium]|nr:sigma-70 family RNA polymerase sigma factor [Saprospirales bacterium]